MWRRSSLCALFAACGACSRPAPPKPSVLLVTIDTLRADHVGAYGAATGATPTLDALARQGVLWEQATTAVPLTLPSHATILTGLFPPHHGVRDNGAAPLDASRPTLASRAKEAGYATAAFVGAYVLDRRFGLANGFDVYEDRIERGASDKSRFEVERRCDAVAASAEAWLASAPGPFLAWVHFFDPHFPYDPPPQFAERFAGRAYDGEVAAADACLSRVLGAARGAAANRLLVAVLSDHGEGLGDHGETTHGFFVYQSTLRIPLVLAGPGLPSGERRHGVARTVDVLPTLLGRLGVPVGSVDGIDLLAGSAPRESYAETRYPGNFGWAPLFALRVGRDKFVDAPHPELYDLEADPGELRNLAAERPTDVARLRRAVQAARGTDESASRVPRTDVAEKLRALGYVSAPAVSTTGPRKDPKDAIGLWRAFEDASWRESRGEREAAILAMRGLVAQEPDNATFLRTLASTLRRAGRATEAVAVLKDLERIAPHDPAAWHDEALSLAAAGRLADAVRADERAALLDPSAPEPFNHRAVLLATLGRYGEALAAADEATRLDANDARAWNNRANVLRALSRFGEAEQDYRRATALEPQSLDAWNGLGVLAFEKGDHDGAAALFGKVLALDPGYQEARLNLAALAASRGSKDEARALAGQVVAAAPPGSPLSRRARALLQDIASIR